MQCWHHISGFNNFQQTVLLLQANLLKDAEQINNSDELKRPRSETLPDSKETIVIDDDDDDDDKSLLQYSSELPTSSGYGNEQFCDTDSVGYTGNLTDTLATSDTAERINCELDANQYETSGDVFIVDELQNEMDNWNDEANNSSENTHAYITELLDAQVPNKVKESLKQSDRIIAKWRPFLECYICSQQFKNYLDIKHHFAQIHTKQEFYISCCSRRLKERFRVVEHARVHLNPQSFKCNFCDKCFTAKNTLYTHLMQLHPNEDDIYPKCRHICNVCGKGFRVPSQLREHIKRHMSNDGRPLRSGAGKGIISKLKRALTQ